MRIVLLVFIYIIPIYILGQSDSLAPIQTDRPTQAVAASAIPAKSLQIESGLIYQKLTASPETDRLAWNTLWRFGVLKGLELRLVTQPEWRSMQRSEKVDRQISGLADLQAGVKLNLWQRPGSPVDVALVSQAIIPSGSQSLTNNRWGSINRLALSHPLFKNQNITYNLGFDYNEGGPGRFFYALAWSASLNSSLSLFVEPYGQLADSQPPQYQVDAGLTYLLNRNWQLDYVWGTDLEGGSHFHSIGVSYLFRL